MCLRAALGLLYPSELHVTRYQALTHSFMSTDTRQPGAPQSPMDSFISHLATLLAVYDSGPRAALSVPQYDGPTDLRTDTILKSLSTMALRMWTAEEAIEKYKLGTAPVTDFIC
jgi:hypothetical protein